MTTAITGTMYVPNLGIKNSEVAAAADILYSKLEHEHRCGYAQESATTAADEARVIYVCRGATGTALAFSAGCVVANIGDSKVEFDLLKNGVSILNAVIQVDSGDAAYAVVAGSFSSTALVAGDKLEVSINATVGTGTLGKGAFCSLSVSEKAS